MGNQEEVKGLRSIAIQQGATQSRIEEFQVGEGWLLKLRLSSMDAGQQAARPLELSEDELIELLQKAIRAGILSADFVKNLSAEFEI